MLSSKLLPKFFKDVLNHIPTIALKSLDWKEVIKEMGPMVFKVGTSSLEDKNMQSLKKLNFKNVQILKKFDHISKNELTEKEKQLKGELIIKLYFSQFTNKDGLILDLRSTHFKMDNNNLIWKPNNSWYQLDDNFRESIINIYKGFYFNNNQLFELGLESIGLTKELNQSKKEELKNLFFAHFGPGEQEMVKFELESFSESFYKLFHFFVTNKIKLHKDFIFIGIYLVTLYMHLEKLNLKFNVRKCFTEVFSES